MTPYTSGMKLIDSDFLLDRQLAVDCSCRTLPSPHQPLGSQKAHTLLLGRYQATTPRGARAHEHQSQTNLLGDDAPVF